MMPERLPSILVVDDEPETIRSLEGLLHGKADVEVRHPREVTATHLSGADLVLVDYLIDQWPERERVDALAQRPMNGLAVASILRAHLEHNDVESTVRRSPTAFALNSAHLALLSGGLPIGVGAHAIARANNLEWAFSKQQVSSSPVTSPLDQWVSLADAVRRLPAYWPSDTEKVKELARHFFGLSSEISWSARAWADIEDCHPPLHELSTATHGLALLRWMLQRILPYPCFLFDEVYLAARMYVHHDELVRLLKSSPLIESLLPFRYLGPLSEFLGPRWWRAGIEAFLWAETRGESYDPQSVRSTLAKLTGVDLEDSVRVNAIVCLDHNYTPLPGLYSAEAAVRIQPDDWPPYAQQAWTTIELANDDPLLGSLVVHEDKDRLALSKDLLEPEAQVG